MAQLARRSRAALGRRDFLRVGTAGLLGLDLPQLLKAEAQAAAQGRGRTARATSAIMIWLDGGPPTIDMWDPKPEAPAGIRGEFGATATAVPGVRIGERLPRMARVMGKCTIVRSLHHNLGAHEPGTALVATGNRSTPTLTYPAFGSLASRLLTPGQGVPAYVALDAVRGNAGLAGYLGPVHNPLTVPSAGLAGDRPPATGLRGIALPPGFAAPELENWNQLLQGLDGHFREVDRNSALVDGLGAFQRQALDILRSERTRAAFDLSREPRRVREHYGLDEFGQAALSARRLVEAGVRFVTVGLGSWDLHAEIFPVLRTNLLPRLDRTLSALIGDLDARGLLDGTVVYCVGEFGRTPRINHNAGRDHWPQAMSVLLAGGGFQRGNVHGGTDAQGTAPVDAPCVPADIAATIFHCLGFEPHTELPTPAGRSVQLFREGRVLQRVLG
jgi:hypothetical protein